MALTSVILSHHIKHNTCGIFEGLPAELLEHITTFSPLTVRTLNTSFYFLSSGFVTPLSMGMDNFPIIKSRCLGNPRWHASLTFNSLIIKSIAHLSSAVWYRLIKEVKNIPFEFMDKLEGTRIHTMQFWGMKLKGEEVNKLSLKGFPLRTLDLSNNYLGSNGVIKLSLQGTDIQDLILKHNNIGDRGALGLPLQNTEVLILDLSFNRIGDQGAKGLPLDKTKILTVYLGIIKYLAKHRTI